jgi:hypothetical protein
MSEIVVIIVVLSIAMVFFGYLLFKAVATVIHRSNQTYPSAS